MAPGTSLQDFVTAAFTRAIAEINGDFGKFGLAIFGILLSWHVLLGGAELASGDQNCRFFKGSFYVRFFSVCAVMLFFDQIFVRLSQAVATSSANAMVTILAQPFSAVESVVPQIISNQEHLVDSSTSAWSIATAPFSLLVSFMVCGACSVLCIVCYYVAALLMAVQGYVAIAYSAIILILAPVLIPFGIHESTEGIAWQYVKGWLVYGVLYLPICVIAMDLASALLTVSATSMNAQGLTPNGIAAMVVQLLSVIAAPLAVIGIVFVPNAALNKVL